MKLQLEQEDITAIAGEVVERIKPMLENSKAKQEDVLFDVAGLAEYLKVKRQWIYDNVHANNIPFLKAGNFLRFRKLDIDKWLAQKNGNIKTSKEPEGQSSTGLPVGE